MPEPTTNDPTPDIAGIAGQTRFIKNILCSSKVAMNFLHMNVRGLSSSMDTLRSVLHSCEFQFFGVTETWLSKNTRSNPHNINLSGFKFISHPRQNDKIRGGVGMFIKRGINSKILLKSDQNIEVEYMFIEVNTAREKFVIGVVYKPPSSNSIESLDSVLSDFALQYNNIILMGDFNVDMLKDNTKTRSFLNFWTALNLHPITFQATHFGPHNPSSLDLFVTNHPNKILRKAQLSLSAISDHE